MHLFAFSIVQSQLLAFITSHIFDLYLKVLLIGGNVPLKEGRH